MSEQRPPDHRRGTMNAYRRPQALRLALLFLHVSAFTFSRAEECFPQPRIKDGMQYAWFHTGNDTVIPPFHPNMTILRGPLQKPPTFSAAYGTACPTSGPIYGTYYTEILTANPIITVLLPSSNITLAPFSNRLLPVERMVAGSVIRPSVNKTCDSHGRCIEAYELRAGITELDMGFRTRDGQPLLSQWLTYNGLVPGPRFDIEQGVQTLIRLHNHIHCNTTTWKPLNSSCSYFKVVDKLSLHNHGGSSLSPFDGWAHEAIHACEWKDYVFPNEKVSVNWYHDHALDLTAITAGMGLAGAYYVKPCGANEIPTNLLKLGFPQSLIITDMVFMQQQGSRYMNPALFAGSSKSAQKNDAAMGDHILVNGRPWPAVQVQRRPYWFILHVASQARSFNMVLNDQINASMPMWVVGAEGGLRASPFHLDGRLLMGPGERYQVVLDFSSRSVGDEIILYNIPSIESNFGQACYAHLVMKFVVGGQDPPSPPFDSNYTKRVLGGSTVEEIDAACSAAKVPGTAGSLEMDTVQDVPAEDGSVPRAFTSVGFNKTKVVDEQWIVAMMGKRHMLRAADAEVQRVQPVLPLGEEAAGLRSMTPSGGTDIAQDAKSGHHRELSSTKPGGLPYVIKEFVPVSIGQNSWASLEIFNSGVGTHPHPIHVHGINFYLCNRTNEKTHTSLEGYETHTPKDTFYSRTLDVIQLVARFGPNQGSYQFHCHNLIHEDQGMMGQYNVTSTSHPAIDTVFANGTKLSNDNYGMGVGAYDKTAVDFHGSDPLVKSVPGNRIIGHKLYYPGSMPPWAQRTDSKHPGRPQPLTKKLLKQVLKRNYYKIFYPDGRDSLSKPVLGNAWAVVCVPEEERR